MILLGLVLVSCMGAAVIVWHNHRIENLLTHIVEEELTAYQIAETLEKALVNQKGFVSYYFLDNNPDWLQRLGEYRQLFKDRLAKAIAITYDPNERKIILRIDRKFGEYVKLKDQVIELFKNGETQLAMIHHQKVRTLFFSILSDCEMYKLLHDKKIKQAGYDSRIEAKRLKTIAGVSAFVISSLSLSLIIFLARRILDPLRKMVFESRLGVNKERSKDEVQMLSHSIKGLIHDAGQKHRKLEESRKHLIQSEKLALVGKLAAGMAHSVRNPLTSVKMRLFSLSRTLTLNEYQREDFDVISEEIRHVDTIVQNFLEFSRPPKLNLQWINPSQIVDLALQLLQHRLKSYDVSVNVTRNKALPKIKGDPEQLKEVIVNLIVNACEAMENGGLITIAEVIRVDEVKGRVISIELTDNGPGVPESIRDKILQPFFTTKDEGTGLGLSIASRIIEEHNGYLDFKTEVGIGTTFSIHFLLDGEGHEDHSNY